MPRIFLVMGLLAFVPAAGYGIGQQDDSLQRADELISQRRYSEALVILTNYARENPKQFDGAQKRIKKIVAIRETYNTTVQSILDELEKETPDDAKILVLTDKLKDLDPQRITETQDFISNTRDVALFRSYMRQLDKVLSDGQELVARGRFAEALQTYAGGFSIYRNEFFSAGYGQAMENRVRQGITNINNNINGITSATNALQEAVNALEALSGQGIEPQNLVAYRAAYNRLSTEMERFIAQRNIFANTNAAFKEDLALLRRNFPQARDRNFLAFAVRLMEGRADAKGMLGVFDTVWLNTVPRARDLLDQKTQAVFLAAVNDASMQEYGNLVSRSDTLAGYGSLPVNLQVIWGRYELNQKASVFDTDIPAGEAGNFLRFRAMEGTAGYWRTMGQLGSRYNSASSQDTVTAWRNGGNGDELIRTEQNSLNLFRQLRTEAGILLSNIQQRSAEYRALENRFANSGSQIYLSRTMQAAENLLNQIIQSEEASSRRRYIIANGMMQNRIAAREGELREGTQLNQGTQREGYIARYPTQAANILSRMDTAIEADRQALQNLLGQYSAEIAEIAASPQIRSLREEAAGMMTRLDNIRTQGRNLAAMARTQSADAANLRRDGDRLVAEARAAFQRGDFETALNRIERASEAYNQSLDREDDAETMARRNSEIPGLNLAITEAYNREVIRQVDGLIAQIKNNYYSSDFDQAERLVSRAQNIWKQTQSEVHHELEYWARMIEAGARSGRTIPPTAPLYAEMSQLLSDARKNYESGRTLISTSRPEATRMLNTAKANIEKIKLVYPMNEEAGILDLRIDQIIDPNFQTNLDGRIQSAIQRTRTGAISGRIEAVNLLRIYAAEFPGARNWNAILRQAEEDAELRPRAPTPEAVAEAAGIVSRAESVIASGNIDRMKDALPDLGRAMTIDPNNQRARQLYNDISTRIRRTTTILDTEGERLFNQANIAYSQNNYIRAQRLLQDIYARNPDFRYIDKVINLQRRVDAVL